MAYKLTRQEQLIEAQSKLEGLRRKRERNGEPIDQPDSIYEGTVRYLANLVQLEERLRMLQVPAAFLSLAEAPDTDESAAARQQWNIARGRDVADNGRRLAR